VKKYIIKFGWIISFLFFIITIIFSIPNNANAQRPSCPPGCKCIVHYGELYGIFGCYGSGTCWEEIDCKN